MTHQVWMDAFRCAPRCSKRCTSASTLSVSMSRWMRLASWSCTSPLRIFKPPQNRVKCPISTHVGGGNAMVSHHVVYQLVLFALFWLFVILHLTRPKHPVTAPDTPADPESLTPKRHRSSEPKPFEGLTHKPHCALCEQETSHPQTPPPVAP